jgi:hypothetical protein
MTSARKCPEGLKKQSLRNFGQYRLSQERKSSKGPLKCSTAELSGNWEQRGQVLFSATIPASAFSETPVGTADVQAKTFNPTPA